MRIKNFVHFFYNIVKVGAVAATGGFFTAQSVKTWYVVLNKPTFNPPSWLFSPVWATLYIMMAISAYLIWKKSLDKKSYNEVLSIYNLQLGLNLLWSILFFGLKSPLIAFIEILILWGVILYTIIRFKNIYKPSAILLIPYLLWVSFAAILNLAIVILN